MQAVYFRMELSRDQVLSYYQGMARKVVVTATDGRRVQFPAEHLRPFVAANGVHGLFEMILSDEHRLIELRRLRE